MARYQGKARDEGGKEMMGGFDGLHRKGRVASSGNAPLWLPAPAAVELSEAGAVDCGLEYCLNWSLFFGIR